MYGWHDNELEAYNVIVENDLTVKGTISFGDEVADKLIIQGRVSSMTAAGAAMQITSAYAYGEGIEMRYQVTDWTGVGSSFKGMYLRSEAITTAATGKSIYGAEVYGVCNNVTMTTGSLWGALFYAYVKGVGAVTVNNMYAVQGELTWDASRTHDCTITTAAACFRAKITGGRVADYTKIHGYELTIGEMDGDSAKFGKGLFMQDDSGMSGTCTLTTGIDIAIGCTTGISIGGDTTDAISISGDATTAINITSGCTPTYGINVVGACTTSAINVGASANGVVLTGVTGYAIDIATSGFFRMGIQGTGIPVTTSYPFAMEVHTEPGAALTAGSTGLSCGIRSRYEISVAQTNQISISSIDARLRVKHNLADGEHCGVRGVIEASDNAVLSGTATTQRNAVSATLDFSSGTTITSGWLTGVTIDSSVDGSISMGSCTFVGMRIKTGSGKEVWEHGIYLDDDSATTGITIGNCTTAGITITGTAATAQINIAGTAILTSGEQAIYVNCPAETVATNGVWVTLKSTVTSGDLTGGRFISESLRETSGGPNVRGVYGQARCKTANKYAALLQGGLFVADYNGGTATVTDMYGVTGFISQGAGLTTSGNVAAVQAHLQTRSDESIGVHTGVLINNEAVGGNGLCLAQGAIYITETSLGGSVKGFDCLIDASTATMTVHDTDRTTLMKFKDSGGTVRKLVFDPTNNTVVAVQT